MYSWSQFGIFSVLLLATNSTCAPLLESICSVQASVPIVNECSGLPALFDKDWHYRNTFNVVIEKGAKVKFELLNPESIGNGTFSVTCLQNTNEDGLELTFSKNNPFSYQIVADITCVPTVGVLKLCNSAPVDLIVSLTSMENSVFLPLPIVEIESFQTYSYNKQDVEKFLKQIIHYGFVKTPRAQVLIGLADVKGLLENDRFIDGLMVINDVIEKYNEYSGRSSIPIAKGRGPQVNMALENDVLLLKSQQCSPKINNDREEDYTVIMPITYSDDKRSKVDGKFNCNIKGYYDSDKVVNMADNILDFFTPDAKRWILLHEMGHHFDLHSKDLYINVAEVWVNLYASFYQSRFAYENETDYWMQNERDDATSAVKLYDMGILLRDFPHRQRAHFLMALFTLDNHDSSVFRSYNIRTMNDPDISNNILKSIAIFIKDQYNVNVAPFIERVVYKEVPWLNLTNIYDLVELKSFRMPCFYYPKNETDYASYRFGEHNLKSTTNLRLCSTNNGSPKKMKIVVEKSELKDELVHVNSIAAKISKSVIEMESSEEVFSIWGEMNKTAVVLPTYTFCNSKTNYECTVAPKLLTYDYRNPSQLFPPFRFDILGYGNELIAIVQVDLKNQTMLIKTLVENGHSYFPSEKGAYVELKLYDSSNSQIASYKINGTNATLGDIWFDIGFNYTFELVAREKNRVKIFNFNLNDFETSEFKISKFGVNEMSAGVGRSKILERFAEILFNDLEYKPHLKRYQHLTDLLCILNNAVEN